MVTSRIRLAWLVSVSIGACLALATAIAAYASESFVGFIIGVAVSCTVYCIIFHGLCLLLVPEINALITKVDTKVEGTTHIFKTHYLLSGDAELDKYISRYIEARQQSLLGKRSARSPMIS